MIISDDILGEVYLLSIALSYGVILAVVYDCIRVLRRIVIHKRITGMIIEDVIFWIIAGFVIFVVGYKTNNGVIRGFVIIGLASGAAMYEYAFSRLVVNTLTRIIKVILIPIKALKKMLSSYIITVRKRIVSVKRKRKGMIHNAGKTQTSKIRIASSKRRKN